MQARTGLSGGNLGSEGHIIAILESKVADNPLCNHQLVGSLTGRDWQELNLVLLIHHVVNSKVTNLGVSVFYLSAGLGNISHALGAEIVELGIRCRLVVALLVCCRVHAAVGGNHIILQFTHCLELQAGNLIERTACLAQGILGRTLKLFTVLVEI